MEITGQPITRKQHAIADYAFIAATAAAPRLMGFEEEERATSVSYKLSCAVLGQNLSTRSEWGLVKLLPFKAHIAVDYMVGALTIAAPWVFGFSDNRAARNSFLAIGTMGLLATIMTKPEEMPLDGTQESEGYNRTIS